METTSASQLSWNTPTTTTCIVGEGLTGFAETRLCHEWEASRAPKGALDMAEQQKSSLPPHILAAIHGQVSLEEKRAAYSASLVNWWQEYSDRKNDEDEHVADSLLYDRRHLPRSAPAPQEWHDAGRPTVARGAAEKGKSTSG